MPLTDSSVAYPFAESEPLEVLRPAAETAAAELVKDAADRSLALVPVGGGTSLCTGNSLRASSWAALSTKELTGQIEFSADDMVVTAPAGTSLAALQAVAGRANQFLPIDHPKPESATLGGIVASNAQEIWRAGYGLPRDRLLGVKVVLADGSIVKGGGKVVKNVAGYDLNKLFAGSWGTLGLITEVTFKTNPLPETSRHLNFRAESVGHAAQAALAVYEARLDPVYAVAANFRDATLSVGLFGNTQTVEWQGDSISKVVESKGLRPANSDTSYEAVRGMIPLGESLVCRFSALPAELPALISELMQLPVARVRAQITAGVVDVEIVEEAQSGIIAALKALTPEGAHLLWRSVPKQWRPYVGDVWGPVRGDFALMRAIKRALDPKAIFSPGRFIGGI